MMPYIALLILSLFVALPAQADLTVSTTNPRWIVDSTTGKAIYFSSLGGGAEGSAQFNATFRGLQDIQRATVHTTDFPASLSSVTADALNAIRLWQLEQRAGSSTANFSTNNYFRVPTDQQPYLRVSERTDTTTGYNVTVGVYDLSQYNQAYFDRLLSRAQQARAAGLYPTILLFSSGHLKYFDYSIGHPYQSGNNVNGINADTNADGEVEETTTLADPAVTAFQNGYICKFVETFKAMGDLIIEVSNEVQTSGSEAWQDHVIDQIHACEATTGSVRHLVAQSAYDFGSRTNNNYLTTNPKPDIVMPTCTSDGTNYDTNPPASPASKPIRWYDTDHAVLTCGTIAADVPWRNFTRGNYFGFLNERETEPVKATVREAMAQTVDWANVRLTNLVAMVPETGTSICESGYCLYNPDGSEFLMYLPSEGTKYINLSSWTGQYRVQHFNPADGTTVDGSPVAGGASHNFNPSWTGSSVVYLKRTPGGPVVRQSVSCVSGANTPAACTLPSVPLVGNKLVLLISRSQFPYNSSCSQSRTFTDPHGTNAYDLLVEGPVTGASQSSIWLRDLSTSGSGTWTISAQCNGASGSSYLAMTVLELAGAVPGYAAVESPGWAGAANPSTVTVTSFQPTTQADGLAVAVLTMNAPLVTITTQSGWTELRNNGNGGIGQAVGAAALKPISTAQTPSHTWDTPITGGSGNDHAQAVIGFFRAVQTGGGGGTPTAINRTLRWTDNAANETSYRVEKRTDQSFPTWVSIASGLNPNTTTYTAQILATETGDCWRVFAGNANGERVSNEACGPAPNVPPMPPPAPPPPVIQIGGLQTLMDDELL